jgi:CheY-like chemotaxis protein
VYGIVRQSAGAVTLASAPGAGTRVKVYLPSSPSGAAARAGAPSPDTPPEHGARPSAGTVLLVEDEPRVRAQTRRLLERCGYAVIEAADGAEGALRFDERRSDVDVVVSDIVMPRLGGVEMVARLRTTVPDVPVVFVSGYAAEDRALPLDARTAFVPKPYTIATLCAAIAAVVAG